MKLCNFASLDPAQKSRKIKGLRNASSADKRIFSEFDADWENLAAESEAAARRIGARKNRQEEQSLLNTKLLARETEAFRSVKVRLAQSLFRDTVLSGYGFRCAISGIALPSLLQASHIIPWAYDKSRRLDPRNGIALSALHDRAFDRGLITVDQSLRVVVSDNLRKGKPGKIQQVALLAIEGVRIRLPSRYRPDPVALRWHQENVFDSNKVRAPSELS